MPVCGDTGYVRIATGPAAALFTGSGVLCQSVETRGMSVLPQARLQLCSVGAVFSASLWRPRVRSYCYSPGSSSVHWEQCSMPVCGDTGYVRVVTAPAAALFGGSSVLCQSVETRGTFVLSQPRQQLCSVGAVFSASLWRHRVLRHESDRGKLIPYRFGKLACLNQ
jgi:hypothetical protein